MSSGVVKGVCAETAQHFYTNSSGATAYLNVWIKNSGGCNVVIEIGDSAPVSHMSGVSEWKPGDDFLQGVQVPPGAHLWFGCSDIFSGTPVPGPGSNCSFEWEVQGDQTIPRWLDVSEQAIDPLALLLPGEVYVKLKLPNPSPDEFFSARVRELVRGMSPREKRYALARIKGFRAYASVVEQELKG